MSSGTAPASHLRAPRPKHLVHERAADTLALAAARFGVSPRAVAGLLLVLALVGAVLGARTLIAQGRAVPRPIGTAAPVVAPGGLGERAGPSPGSGQRAGTSVTGIGASAPTAPTALVVHVVGQVRHPGVVRLAPGARVQQALAGAGGPLPTADLAAVNLARLLVDGEQIVVPRPGEGGGAGSGAVARAASGAVPEPVVNLNTANLAELDSLPGVGPVLAQRILDWRAQNGRFSTVDELGEVSGIGEAVLGRLRPRVRV